MKKKLLAVLLAAIMLIPMSFLASCHNDGENSQTSTTESSQTAIVLTPKETFIKAIRSSGSSLKEISNQIGLIMPDTKATDKKKMSGNFEIQLKELSVSNVPYIQNPIKIGFDYKSDAEKFLSELKGNITIENSKVPLNIIVSKTAAYFGIDKVTEKTLMMPIEASDVDLSSLKIDLKSKLDVYFDAFSDSLTDDMFTQKSGDVTVDGAVISGANTVEIKITEKQLLTAIKALLEKAKTDKEIEAIYNALASTGMTEDTFEEAISNATTEIAKSIDDSKDGNYAAISVVTENGVFRSVSADLYEENNKQGSLTFSDIKKDGENVVKLRIYKDTTDLIVLSLNQKSNSNGSADGKISLVINVEELNKASEDVSVSTSAEKADTSSSTSSVTGVDSTAPSMIELSATYKGTKTDNKLALDIVLELTLDMDGAKVTFGPKINLVQEKVSDNEYKYSGDLSFSAQGIKLALAFSSADKVDDSVSITVPADSECQVIDETFDATTLIGKLAQQYPDIMEFIMQFMPSSEG